MNQFHPNPTTQEFRSTMAINTSTGFVAECDYDDDVFYAELRKQILLLTDDEEFPDTQHPGSIRATRQSANVPTAAAQTRSYFSWGKNDINTSPAPAWLLKLWSNGSGTGVFIPHVVNSKRAPGRSNKARGKLTSQWRTSK